MQFASIDLRRVAWASWGLLLAPGIVSAETKAKQPVGAVTAPAVSPFDPWGDEQPAAFHPWEGGVATEEQARQNSNCGNCDTVWGNVNYGNGYANLPLPAWTDMPRWYVGFEGVFLTRDNGEDFTVATQGARGPEALSTEDLDHELRPGVRFTLGRTINDYFRVEGTYLGQQHWDDTVTVRNESPNALGGNGNLFSFFSQFGNPAAIAGLDYNNRVTISDTSDLNTAEINVRYRAPIRCGAFEAVLLCGVRYVNVEETFQYLSTTTVPAQLGTTRQIDVETTNDLIGGQIGGNVIYRASQRWWLNLDGKVGVFGNSARQSTDFLSVGAAGFSGEAQTGATAFMGDVRIESCFQLFPRLTVIAGYQAMGVDGLALGMNNLQRDVNILTQGPAEVDDNGTLIYHGPTVGLVWNW